MELVNHPNHYNRNGRKECIVEMQDLFGRHITAVFCLTNAYKYLYRAGEKEGNSMKQDMLKAKWYFDYVTEHLESELYGHGKNIINLYHNVEMELKKYYG